MDLAPAMLTVFLIIPFGLIKSVGLNATAILCFEFRFYEKTSEWQYLWR